MSGEQEKCWSQACSLLLPNQFAPGQKTEMKRCISHYWSLEPPSVPGRICFKGRKKIIFITNRGKCFWYLEDKDSVAITVGLTISHIVNILAKIEFISSVQPRDLVYLNVLEGINCLPKVLKIGENLTFY